MRMFLRITVGVKRQKSFDLGAHLLDEDQIMVESRNQNVHDEDMLRSNVQRDVSRDNQSGADTKCTDSTAIWNAFTASQLTVSDNSTSQNTASISLEEPSYSSDSPAIMSVIQVTLSDTPRKKVKAVMRLTKSNSFTSYEELSRKIRRQYLDVGMNSFLRGKSSSSHHLFFSRNDLVFTPYDLPEKKNASSREEKNQESQPHTDGEEETNGVWFDIPLHDPSSSTEELLGDIY